MPYSAASASEPVSPVAVVRHRFFDLFDRFGQAVGFDATPDDNGVVTLVLAGGVNLSIEAPRESLFISFHSPVWILGKTDRAARMEAMMQQNLFGLPLSGAWLALDAATDEVLLCYSAPGQHLDPDRLVNLVEALGHAVLHLRGDLAGRSREASGPANGLVRI